VDRLEELSAKYSDDAFGKQYNALPGTMRAALADMGVVEFEVAVGDAIDAYRMEVTSSEHSESAPAQTVLRVESKGLELEGNVMRKPKVVASLGPELSLAGGEEAEETASEAQEESEQASESAE
jgi:molecular chaperone GrpE (heat shock protein)